MNYLVIHCVTPCQAASSTPPSCIMGIWVLRCGPMLNDPGGLLHIHSLTRPPEHKRRTAFSACAFLECEPGALCGSFI